MMKKLFILSATILFSITSCMPDTPKVVYHEPLPPAFDCELVATDDTIKFQLVEEAFGDIEAWSIRNIDSQVVVAFFDRFSISISEYEYPSLKFINRIDLARFFKPEALTSAYLQDYNNIFLTSRDSLYLIDSSGKIKEQFCFGSLSRSKSAKISGENLPTFHDGKIYLPLSPRLNRTSKSALRSWEILWSADMQSKSTAVQYHLPDTYLQNLYPSRFLQYNYCMNDSGRFVFSFSADSLLYETDLADYHHAWYAKSRMQKKTVEPITKNKKLTAEKEWELYMTHSAYGAIFYDKTHHRYLRHVKTEVSQEKFKKRDFNGANRVVILDKNFRIIGESSLPLTVSFRKTIIMPDGKIYTKVPSGYDNILSFIRLEYREHQKTAIAR